MYNLCFNVFKGGREWVKDLYLEDRWRRNPRSVCFSYWFPIPGTVTRSQARLHFQPLESSACEGEQCAPEAGQYFQQVVVAGITL